MFPLSPKSNQTKPLKELLVVQPSAEILSDKHLEVIENIKALLCLEESRYVNLVLALVHRLAEHCQHLPETLNSYYSEPGGLLDFHLERTLTALQLLNGYLIIMPDHVLSKEQRLWQYVLLSAGLLQGIGKLCQDYQLNLFDNNGQFIQFWNPLVENLTDNAQYYDYEYKNQNSTMGEVRYKQAFNLLLARFLMPISGFSWISSNRRVLKVWIDLLNEESYLPGTLNAVLNRAKSLTIQEYFEQMKFFNLNIPNSQLNKISTFGDNSEVEVIEKKLAIEFLIWVKNNIDNQKIILNKAPIFTVPGGLLISIDMFKLFIREHPEFKNWQAVLNAFLHLNIHKVNQDGDYLFRFKQKSSSAEGVFIENSIPLPKNIAIVVNNQIQTITDLEFAQAQLKDINGLAEEQLKSLNNAGEWQVATDKSNPISLSESQR